MPTVNDWLQAWHRTSTEHIYVIQQLSREKRKVQSSSNCLAVNILIFSISSITANTLKDTTMGQWTQISTPYHSLIINNQSINQENKSTDRWTIKTIISCNPTDHIVRVLLSVFINGQMAKKTLINTFKIIHFISKVQGREFSQRWQRGTSQTRSERMIPNYTCDADHHLSKSL